MIMGNEFRMHLCMTVLVFGFVLVIMVLIGTLVSIFHQTRDNFDLFRATIGLR